MITMFFSVTLISIIQDVDSSIHDTWFATLQISVKDNFKKHTFIFFIWFMQQK